MDKKIANNTIVGIFVCIGLAAFVWVLFKINGGQGLFSTESMLFAKFTQVKGLNFGSEVSLMGVRIGTVRKVAVLDPKTKELVVEFTVSREAWDKIRTDSIAAIRTSGVLGDKYLEITIGNPELPTLKPGDFIQTEETKDIFSRTGNLIEDITKQFEKGGNGEALLKNLNKVANNLAELTQELKNGQTFPKLAQSMNSLDQILRKVNNGDGTLGALINDPTVYEDVKTLMGGAKRSSVLRYFMNSFMESGSEAKRKKQ